MQKPIGLGFIGCGKHAIRAHAKVAKEMMIGDAKGLFSIAAAYDPNESAVAQMAELAPTLYRAKSAEDLLACSEVDAVVIATPHQFHLDLMERAVAAKKNVLCEKPLWMGDKANRFTEILWKARLGGLIVTSCHPRRFEPYYVELHDKMDTLRAVCGKPVEFNFRFFYHKPPAGWRQEDSLLLDHMNHEIDIANFILGLAPVHLRRIFDGYDRYQVTGMRMDGVSLNFSGYRCLENRRYANELEIVFERARIRVVSELKDGVVKARIIEEDLERGSINLDAQEDYPYEISFAGVMASFGFAIQGVKENYLSGQDMVTNTDSCNQLLRTGEYRL